MDSLQTRCLYYIVNNLELCYHGIEFLPRKLKTKIFEIISRRSNSSFKKTAVKLLIHPDLREVDLSSCTLDGEIMATMMHCQNLTHFNISGGDTTSQDITNILKSPGSVHLMSFIADNCQAVDDEVLAVLSNNCKQLEILDLKNCQSITDEGVSRLKVLALTAVNISSTKISDRGVLELCLGNSCRTLKELQLMGLRISGDSVKQIGMNCRELRTFKICNGDFFDSCHKVFGKFHQIDWTVKF